MVALPITNDQPGVAVRIANKKVGVVISPHQASPENFVIAIKQVLGDPRFRDNAQRVQEAIRCTEGLSIAAGILERAFELEEREQGGGPDLSDPTIRNAKAMVRSTTRQR